jgi:hypothetical protein
MQCSDQECTRVAVVECGWDNECCGFRVDALCLQCADLNRRLDNDEMTEEELNEHALDNFERSAEELAEGITVTDSFWTCGAHGGRATLIFMKHRAMCGSQDGGA